MQCRATSDEAQSTSLSTEETILNDSIIHKEKYTIDPLLAIHVHELGHQWMGNLSELTRARDLLLQKIQASINQFTPHIANEQRYQLRQTIEEWIWKEDYLFGCTRKQQHSELQQVVFQMIQEYIALKSSLQQSPSTSTASQSILSIGDDTLSAEGSRLPWGQNVWEGMLLACPPNGIESMSIVICHQENSPIQLVTSQGVNASSVHLIAEPNTPSLFTRLQSSAYSVNIFGILPLCYHKIPSSHKQHQLYSQHPEQNTNIADALEQFSLLIHFIQQAEHEYLFSIPAQTAAKDSHCSQSGKLFLLPYRFVLEWGLYEHIGTASLTRPLECLLLAVFLLNLD